MYVCPLNNRLYQIGAVASDQIGAVASDFLLLAFGSISSADCPLRTFGLVEFERLSLGQLQSAVTAEIAVVPRTLGCVDDTVIDSRFPASEQI